MPIGFIQITSRPNGGAPSAIRDQWVGLILPIEQSYNGPLGDVMSGRLVGNGEDGYQVRWEDAMTELGKRSQEAVEWWCSHVSPQPLIFLATCLEILPD